jgi:hypothetical protein
MTSGVGAQPPCVRCCASRPGRPLAALALAGLLGACSNDGGSDDGDASASSDHDLSAAEQAEFETAVEFAQSMRDHGIEGLPDPQVSGNGFLLLPARPEPCRSTAPASP